MKIGCNCSLNWEKLALGCNDGNETRVDNENLPKVLPVHPECRSTEHSGISLLSLENLDNSKYLFVKKDVFSKEITNQLNLIGVGRICQVPGYKRKFIPSASISISEKKADLTSRAEMLERIAAIYSEMRGLCKIEEGESITNGCGYGKTIEDAKGSAQSEIIERHILIKFWKSKKIARKVEYDLINRESVLLESFIKKNGYKKSLFQLTSEDSLIHVFLCLLEKQSDNPLGPPLAMGYGAHSNFKTAAQKSLKEAVQVKFFLLDKNTDILAIDKIENMEPVPESNMRYYFNHDNVRKLIANCFIQKEECDFFTFKVTKQELDSINYIELSSPLLDSSKGNVVRAFSTELEKLKFGVNHMVEGFPHPFS